MTSENSLDEELMNPDYAVKIRRASTLVQDGPNGVFTWGEFDRLHADLLVGDVRGQADSKIRITLSNIHQDLWNLLSVISKLEWIHALHSKGELDLGLYMMFATSDVDLFVVQLRATFNEIARAVDDAADKPGEMPGRFGRLIDWFDKSLDRSQRVFGSLSDELCDLLRETSPWFEDIRAIRDSMLYKGGRTLVFPDRAHILFQVHEGLRNRVFGPFMHNKNVADFRRFAAMYLLLLMDFLESFSSILRRKLSVKDSTPLGGANIHLGFGELRRWSHSLFEKGS